MCFPLGFIFKMSKEVVFIGNDEGNISSENQQSLAQKPFKDVLQYETLQKTFMQSGSGSVPNTFYTVPQGKKFLLYGFNLGEINAAGRTGNFYLLDRTGATQLYSFGVINQYQPVIETAYNPPLIISEGYMLQVVSNTAGFNVTVNAYGYEVDKN